MISRYENDHFTTSTDQNLIERLTRSLLLVLLLTSVLPVLGQHTISGYVSDASSGERLLSATIYHVGDREGDLIGTVSNSYGFYSLTLDVDSVDLIISFTGYSSTRHAFALRKDTTLNIELEASIELETVKIIADRTESITESSSMSTVEIPVAQIKALPAFLGEADVLKALQLLPGVQSGSEGSAGLYVRGGGPDQNLILLDGVPVYNASHLFGFFSVFNPDAVQNVKLVKGGFPARYGGRLSSVVDIRLKEGNTQELKGAGAIGLISSKLTLEGPLGSENTSFLVSGRRTYIDILAQPFILASTEGGTGGYYFYDLNAKFNHRFSDKDRLFVSGYFGRDRFYFRDTYSDPGDGYEETFKGGIGWGNTTGVIRWNRVISPKTFGNLTATWTNYKFDVSNEYEEIETNPDGSSEESGFAQRYFSKIEDVALRYDLDFHPNPKHDIRMGATATWHRFQPGVSQFELTDQLSPFDTTLSALETDAGDFTLYFEDDLEIGSRIKANIGVHFSAFVVDGQTYGSVEPRFSMRYRLATNWSLKASVARMTQYIHLLNNVGIGLPTDLWVPSTENVGPQRSWQGALGVTHEFADFEFSLEGYYKRMDGIIEYKDGASFVGSFNTNWEDQVASGLGESYGAEFFVQRKFGSTTGWLGYTLSWANRTFDDINFGETFPYRYDRRHDLSIAVVHRFNERIEISSTWVYGTGNSVSLPVAVHEGLFGQPVEHYDGRNGVRLPSYHRLDFGARFSKEKPKYRRTFAVGVYNVYNRRNPFFIYRGTDDFGEPAYKQVSLFPILPSFSWQFEF